MGSRGGSKKNKRTTRTAADHAHVAENAKPDGRTGSSLSKTRAKRPRNKGIDRTAVDIVYNDERNISGDELEEMMEYENFQGFLRDLDPQDLARKVKKRPFIGSDLPLTSKTQSRRGTKYSDSESSDVMEAARPDKKIRTLAGSHMQTSSAKLRSEDAQEPELSVRSFKSSGFMEDRLPIKLSDGSLRTIVRDDVAKSSSKQSASVEMQSQESAALSGSRTANQTEFPLADQLLATQERLARIATEIIEDPEGQVEQLIKLKQIQEQGDTIETRYAILTLSTVFKDIIPGYRIRPLTAVEQAEKITKDVRAIRTFEQTLIHQYQDFVMSLTRLSKTAKPGTTASAVNSELLKETVITAACSLLTSVPHFNFRTELLSILINQVCRKTVDRLFIHCRFTLENLFREDQEGEVSFEAMRLLCKRMKDRNFDVDESALSIFLHLRLLSNMEARGSINRVEREKAKKKDRQFRTKALKKLIKDQKEVEKDLREAEASVDTETRERLQGEILKLVFSTYFRVLKEGRPATVGAALEGLAKFAHLINVDFFGDLLEVLKELMRQGDNPSTALTTRGTLLCIVTAFTLLSGQGETKETVGLDLSTFMEELYSVLLTIALDADLELSAKSPRLEDPSAAFEAIKSRVNVATEAEMLLRALDVIFRQRQQSHGRLSAFVKRLSTAALNFPEKSSRATLELTKRLVARHSKLYSLYSTDESAGDGIYNGETDSADLSNTSATTMWEIALFRLHFSPKVRAVTQELLTTLNDSVSTSR